MSDSVRPHQWQPTRLPHPWDSPGKNTGVGCHLRSLILKFSSLIIQLYAIYFPLSSTAWQVGVHGVTKSQDTTEATEHTHTHTHTHRCCIPQIWISWVLFCVLLCDCQSGVATKGNMGEAQEDKFIKLPSPSIGCRAYHAMQATWEGLRVVSRQKVGMRGKPRLESLLEFLWDRQGRAK